MLHRKDEKEKEKGDVLRRREEKQTPSFLDGRRREREREARGEEKKTSGKSKEYVRVVKGARGGRGEIRTMRL